MSLSVVSAVLEGGDVRDQGRASHHSALQVLEHVHDPMSALKSMFGTLVPGGRLVLYVPRGQKLYGSLDEALGHRCRYELPMLKRELEETGFEVERMDLFN